eukprot:m.87280 g.87280  ORF g.87280 m.87280 type:complete len:65 (-) comp12825_c0_seq19:3066-3260(-)
MKIIISNTAQGQKVAVAVAPPTLGNQALLTESHVQIIYHSQPITTPQSDSSFNDTTRTKLQRLT